MSSYLTIFYDLYLLKPAEFRAAVLVFSDNLRIFECLLKANI